MPAGIATALFAIGILGLLALDRDPGSRTSFALWIPMVWLVIAGSRMVSQWLATAGLVNMEWSPDSPEQYFEGSPLDRFVLTGLVVLGLMVLLARGKRLGKLLQANGPILLFFSYCALSILWSDYPFVALKRWTKALGDLVMVLIVLTDPAPSAAIRFLLARVGFLLVPLSVLFIKYYPDLGRGYLNWTWTPVFTGVTTNKNLLGMVCLIFGLASEWRFLQACRMGKELRRTGLLAAHGSVLAMVLWLLWKANSMTSLSCFVLAGGLIVAASFPASARKRALVHTLVASVLSVALSVLFLDVGSDLLDTMGRDPTLTGRTHVWDLVLGMTENPLFGTGFESFWLGPRLEKIWSIYWWRPNEAHNGYIEVFLNLGWTGLALLTIIMVTGYRRVVGAVQRDHELGSLRLAYFVVGVIYNFTESAIRTFNPIWIVFLLAIIGVPKARVPETPRCGRYAMRAFEAKPFVSCAAIIVLSQGLELAAQFVGTAAGASAVMVVR